MFSISLHLLFLFRGDVPDIPNGLYHGRIYSKRVYVCIIQYHAVQPSEIYREEAPKMDAELGSRTSRTTAIFKTNTEHAESPNGRKESEAVKCPVNTSPGHSRPSVRCTTLKLAHRVGFGQHASSQGKGCLGSDLQWLPTSWLPPPNGSQLHSGSGLATRRKRR
jgi:hypothetical protein